ncbi:MAG: PQQ-binding-like beta-propeller repeat protein [Acidobacteriia bacterium]|nr:PQQ-binding-like beta-propeller repeat protein [Terriglobia bacterium]MYC68005.1 PQQ-binding-like beta-propeller repeat protein [Terriglobia bacterium]MYG05018.1 PQQ-binding-like beta-propeller repeat protein [Terriglobia bacterium]MYK09011.1 PQQ-binding-like beta-propeller repeat protein [Terriglobia bacterium]
MQTSQKHEGSTSEPKKLRLWPGVAAVSVQWLCWVVLPLAVPGPVTGLIAVAGVLGGGLAVAMWWALLSRAPRPERLGFIALAVVALFVASRLVDESIASGMMGLLLVLYAVPVASLAIVASAAGTQRLAARSRRAAMAAAILLSCGVWTLLRSEGITGAGEAEFRWRWAKTAEQLFLETKGDEPATSLATQPAMSARGGWSGFRGRHRDSAVQGVRIETDWNASPPILLWRRPVGPGTSSFAVGNGLLYTQEQVGEDEAVTCYALDTGELVWMHRDKARFWDSHVGPGPRATPTLGEDRVYALGATGILNALDAADGTVLWSRNAATDTGATVPDWGLAGSPLAVGDLVVVAVSGTLAAYDGATGEPRWFGPPRLGSYSSPHPLTIGGENQVLLMSSSGLTSVAPRDGRVLWEHAWPGGDRIVQPAAVRDGGLLVADGSGFSLRRIAVRREAGKWSVAERWESTRLKPYFNDFVVHEGHAFGFDGSILACIDLEDGSRKWKGGRYGHGQVLLLADQDLLLVLSERGELVTVTATPDRFEEIARHPCIEGKTWNHPALAGDILVARNSGEAAAFRLALEAE